MMANDEDENSEDEDDKSDEDDDDSDDGDVKTPKKVGVVVPLHVMFDLNNIPVFFLRWYYLGLSVIFTIEGWSGQEEIHRICFKIPCSW